MISETLFPFLIMGLIFYLKIFTLAIIIFLPPLSLFFILLMSSQRGAGATSMGD